MAERTVSEQKGRDGARQEKAKQNNIEELAQLLHNLGAQGAGELISRGMDAPPPAGLSQKQWREFLAIASGFSGGSELAELVVPTQKKADPLTRFEAAICEPCRGVAFDLDGTALNIDGRLDRSAVNTLVSVHRLGVPLIIATGRGVQSTDRVCEQLGEGLMYNESIATFVLNYNGALLQRYLIFRDREGSPSVTNQVINEVKLENLQNVFDYVKHLPFLKRRLVLENSSFVSKVRDYGITLVFKKNMSPKEDDADALQAALDEEFGKSEFRVFFSGETLDITGSSIDKKKGLEFLCTFLGIPVEQVATVGDQGHHPKGNDYPFLKHKLGFSVGKELGKHFDSCHPVVDRKTGRVLTGVEGFKYLVSQLDFDTAAICRPRHTANPKIHSTIQRRYYHFVASIGERAQDELGRFKRETLAKRQQLLVKGGLRSSLYGSLTGKDGFIKISSEEIETASGSIGKFLRAPSEYFSDCYRHVMTTRGDQSFIGLGEEVLITLAGADDDRLFGSAVARFKNLVKVNHSLLTYKEGIERQIKEGMLSVGEWKGAMIYFDHVKSTSLRLLHAESYMTAKEWLSKTSPEVQEELSYWRAVIQESVDYFYGLMDQRLPSRVSLPVNTELLKRSHERVSSMLTALIEKKETGVRKVVRNLPEARFPLMNKLFGRIIARELAQDPSRTYSLASLHYGGAELPFIVDYEIRRQGINLVDDIISIHFSNYSNPDQNKKESNFFDREVKLEGKNVLLFDDAVVTGRSLVEVTKLLAKLHANTSVAVQALGSHRRPIQVRESGGAAPSFLDNVHGLVGVSAYRRDGSIRDDEAHPRTTKEGFNLSNSYLKQLLVRYYSSDKLKTGSGDPFKRLR